MYKELYETKLVGLENINLELVAIEVFEILKTDKIKCKCDNCIRDIFAITLNALPPMYKNRNQEKIKLHENLIASHKELLKTELNLAIELVNKNPHHQEKHLNMLNEVLDGLKIQEKG